MVEHDATLAVLLTNHGVDSVELRGKAGCLLLVLIGRLSGKGDDWLDRLNQSRLRDGRIVRGERCCRCHNNGEIRNIEKHRGVRQPADLLQTADYARDHANAHDEDHDSREAKLGMRDLRDVHRFAHDEHSDG